MSLRIQTFTNPRFDTALKPGNNAGGQTLFKAMGHPLVAPKATALLAELKAPGSIAIYDPNEQAACFDAFYDLGQIEIGAVYGQRSERFGETAFGREIRPITMLASAPPKTLLIADFDAAMHRRQIAHLLPKGIKVLGFDGLRLPDDMLANARDYLAPLNFATNFALLRDQASRHTRITGANYWGDYGAANAALWLCLFDADGKVLAQWRQALGAANASWTIDSRKIRHRFRLPDFCGSLFIHALGAARHDVVKYALDTYGSGAEAATCFSCTHDANAWPADFYAGVPAPTAGESIVLWVQNSHPTTIPAGAIGLNPMGEDDKVRWFDRAVPPFGTVALDVGALLPNLRWPAQIEVRAGKHFVRPRYEITQARDNRVRICHANVERNDLQADPKLPTLGPQFGKGYILPLPVLPPPQFHTALLPTPMARDQRILPISVAVYDGDGKQLVHKYLGHVTRNTSALVDMEPWLEELRYGEAGLTDEVMTAGFGHVEFMYDFRNGGEADGWLHATARYRHKLSGHAAETTFGAHIYNTVLTYRDEPQSYGGRPPGLTTRLFLRLGPGELDTICHLIYPASAPWLPFSSTVLTLMNAKARPVTTRELQIPCSGSRFFRCSETFTEEERAEAGEGAWVQVRDPTCRLFGFHGLMDGDRAFSLDHMFGF
jgi:hypothetical protein